jgi:hypothetical protein
MEPPVDVDAVALRASHYWMQDGLVEMTFGLVFAFQAGVSLAWRTPLAGLSAAGYLFIPWGFKQLKERITLPRCSYVAFPIPSRAHVLFLAFVGAAVTLAGVLFAVPYRVLLNRIAIMAFMALSASLFASLQYKQPRTLWDRCFPWLVGLFLGWGVSWPGELRAFDVLIGMMGVSTVVIGARKLRSFLKANTILQDTEA